MGPGYVSVTVELEEQDAELAALALHEAGATGLEVRDREAPPMPGVRGPDPGEAILVAFFDGEAAAREARQEVQAQFPRARVQVEPVATQDWSEAWKARIRSVEVGRLWVGPPWELERAPAPLTKLVIEPKMAFGTGDHPTTSLCLETVDLFLRDNPAASVLDVGTGTGVLAIAARKLGAGRVVGLDNDPTSVELARENAALNRAENVELSGKTLEQVEGTFDLVVANILANTLVELAPLIVPKVAGRLSLSGVLQHQRGEVEAAYRAQGLLSEGFKIHGEWIRLDLTARGW
ncbi:MAG TPA: 50S ribosomal protein L11 methyltransferase [Myxococcaceae bacterium]|nr:50S ribosomal protein L11 methyltransferase [Myxococcaceae bacterium]